MITEQDIPRIIEDVKERLVRKGRERNLDLKLEEQDYHLDDNWLYLAVTPLQEGIRPYDYASAMSEIEAELRKDGIDNVMLVPSFAEYDR